MSWQTEIVESIRIAINDLDCVQTYTDSRLERIAIHAAIMVNNEMDFDETYVIDIEDSTISPDPTSSDPKDVAFMMLVAMKSACLITRGELKLGAASGGIIVKDGPSSIDTSNYYSSLSGLYKQYVEDYEFLKMNYKYIRSVMNSQAIMTPTVVTNIYTNLQVLGY